jgi:outer membrane protein OmpA-like peptidoglycan-associated protein
MLCVIVASRVSAAGAVSSYYAEFDIAGWRAQASVFECRLTQQIPGLGEAVFYHQAGESLSFHLQTSDSPMQAGRALLTSMPPVWRKDLQTRDLGYVDVTMSQRPINLDAALSRLVMAELDRGMVPTLMRRAWYSADESVHVGLSPVNFGQAYQEYHQCNSALLPVNFEQIERSTVFWRSNQRELDAAMRQQLDDIVSYINADTQVYGFEIIGFTDSAGNPTQNLELSRLRAFAVHEYLITQGVNESMLNTRFFGSTPEYRIVRDERTAADRDRNRRVTIHVLRH